MSSAPVRKDSSPSIVEKESLPHNDKRSESEVANNENSVDVVAKLIAGHGEESDLDPQAAHALRKKLDRNMLPLLCALYTLQFIDKNSLGSSSILGIIQDNHLTTNQFNNLSTAFYIGYIIFVGPHAWLMQRFPIAKYIAANIGLWSVFLGLQAVCHNYGGLCCITSGIMTIMTMFYTRVESTQRISWTFMCNGIASIIAAFISFGVAHTKATARPHQWQWFMIIVSILSVIVSALYFWRMPNNPATARFLNEDEKINVIKRIRINQNGVEAKVWKRYQFIEAFTDPKTWFFFLFAGVANLIGGIGIEFGLIIKGFGFNTLETTALSIPMGASMVISISIGTVLIKYFPNSRCILGIIGFIPSSICCFLLIFLPWENKAGLLVAFYLVASNGLGFIMILSLVAVVFSGHTKCSFGFDIFMIALIRWYLVRENKRRDAEKLASGEEYDEFGYVEHAREDGSIVKLKVPIQFMDITDKENKAFRYPL
ncbi:hypothetical protein FRB90_010951 [Tulasnella sp. 427]|nr:hypothetical protein FRB90_010951 [Tulasnella sp. 427]